MHLIIIIVIVISDTKGEGKKLVRICKRWNDH